MDDQFINRKKAKRPASKFSRYKKLIAVSVVVTLILVIGVVSAVLSLSGDKPAADRYQVVVLSSGQTYFGKLKDISGEYLTLENVYYNTAAEVPEDATPEQKAATSGNSTLVKMGSEVYGPESTLKIRSEQVLFWQNLTEDSKVAEAIESAE